VIKSETSEKGGLLTSHDFPSPDRVGKTGSHNTPRSSWVLSRPGDLDRFNGLFDRQKNC